MTLAGMWTTFLVTCGTGDFRVDQLVLLGAGSLFGLGSNVKVSALLAEVNTAIKGRLLVFFPGEHEGNSYRLLDARDGWNYLATPITSNGSRS